MDSPFQHRVSRIPRAACQRLRLRERIPASPSSDSTAAPRGKD